jgi:hypothetical protein
MNSFTAFKIAVAAIGLPIALGLNGCSKKEQTIEPLTQRSINSPDVQLVNGRLSFTDERVFDQVRGALEHKLRLTPGSAELDSWEKSLHFTSLRSIAATQVSQLASQKTSTVEYDLMNSFGFPDFYASLINSSGEYQIGNKIYWFHDKFKYEAASESELAAIKQSPNSAKVKYSAGIKIIKSTILKLGKSYQPNTTIGSQNPQDDYKYHYEFYLNNDPGSYRRIMYNIRIYVEDRGNDPGNYAHYFYTNLSLLIKYEYFNNYYQAWYPANGQQLNWTTAIDFAGTALTPHPLSAPYSQTANSYKTFSFDNGVVGISLGDAYITASTSNPYQDYTTSDVTWNYDISGMITSRPNNDPNHPYTIGNMSGYSPLW